MPNKLMLNGMYYGTKTIKELYNPEILYSVVNRIYYQKNKINFSYNKNTNDFYVYHSYNKLNKNLKEIIYSGRWYSLLTEINSSSLNKKN